MRLEIGSNLLRNVDGAVRVAGIDIMQLECGEDGQLLLTLDACDRSGGHLARLWRNAWAYHDEARTRVETAPEKLTLMQADGDEVLLEVDIVDTDTVRIVKANFCDRDGRVVIVAGGNWQVGDSPPITGLDIDAGGGDVDLAR